MIDSHCHLADEAFAADLEAVVSRARAAGVERALCILSADEPDEIARAAVVRAAWDEVRFAAAVHPNRAAPHDGPGAAALARAAVLATDAVAVGEIGLDYHYTFASRDRQREVFAAQIEVAIDLDRPVVIHTREATDDTLAVLRDAGQSRVRGVMHCFSGTADEARRALDLGFYISLSGIVSFPKAGSLRDLASLVPEDRLLIETDAPYLAPVPHRGKRNEPAWVIATLGVVAAARGMAAPALAERVTANFDSFIGAAK